MKPDRAWRINHLKEYAIAVILGAVVHQTCIAQYPESDFHLYTHKNGLSDNYITALQQDDWGYMWIGTESGLNRFDGYSFSRYFQNTSPLHLRSSIISRLKKLGPHRLGVLTRGGFHLLNTKNLAIANYLIPDTTAFVTYSNHAWDVIPLADSGMALTTASGFYIFENSRKIRYRKDVYHLEDMGKKRIRYGRFFYPLDEKKWVVTLEESGLGLFEPSVSSYREISPNTAGFEVFRRVSVLEPGGKDNIYQLSDHEFINLLVNKDSLVYYNLLTGRRTSSYLPIDARLETDWASSLLRINDSVFAINCSTTGFYLFYLDKKAGIVSCNTQKMLPSHKINCLYLDNEKRLWAGTPLGLLRQKLNKQALQVFTYPPLPFDHSTVGFVSALRYKDKIYVARYSRFAGLFIIDATTMQLQKHVEFFGRDNFWNEVNSIQQYHPDTLWLGTNGGILWFDTRNHHYGEVHDSRKDPGIPPLGNVRLTPLGKDGFGWFCNIMNGLVGRYHSSSRQFEYFTAHTRPALPFDKIKSIAYDAFGDTWISGHSLARWNNSTRQFDTLMSVYDGPNKFNEDILTLVADNNGSLWFHNMENGLLEYRIKEKRFNYYSMEDGLPSNQLIALSPVINDELWIRSGNHLSLFNTQTKKTIVYDHLDGLPDERSFSRYMVYDETSGQFLMLGKNYLLQFPKYQHFSQRKPEILLREAVTHTGDPLFYPGYNLKFSHRNKNLRLHLDIIDFEAGSEYRFAYRLNNSENWIPMGAEREIHLNELSSGKYKLEVKAEGKNGESVLREMNLAISPPFWESIGFRAGIALLVMTGILLLYRYRIRQVRKKAMIDKMLAETEMKALHAQMNPHFIFNSLNSIREMILNHENQEASRYLSKFAHLIRATLDHSVNSFVTLRNTMDYLNRYVEMEKIRNDHFTCSLQVDEKLDMDETVVPPMLIQPFIENAIWHAAAPQQRDLHIDVMLREENGQLVCVVEDNGIGIERSREAKKNNLLTHQPVGIANVKNRILLLNEKYNLESGISIVDRSTLNGKTVTGTRVTIRLPLQQKEE